MAKLDSEHLREGQLSAACQRHHATQEQVLAAAARLEHVEFGIRPHSGFGVTLATTKTEILVEEGPKQVLRHKQG